MLLLHFIGFLIKSGLALTAGLVTIRAIQSLLAPPLMLTPVINIEEGPIQGKIGYSRNGSEYWQFLGIPYAQPPLRGLRFQPPVPAKPWRKTRQTLNFPSACLQFDSMVFLRTSGSEDCLYLNVFASPKETREKKPVIIFVHGGGYYAGESAIYHADYLMDHPVVLVTFNFRLGPFGFLNFEEADPQRKLPRGNMGLKDQNLVLRWVRRNIAKFGGDPNKVTLMGESSGAVSVHLHTMAPLSRNLFRRAIMLSGSALSSWGFSRKPREVAVKYAKKMNCPQDNAQKIFECLQKLDPRRLVSEQWAWAQPLREKDLFLPSVEPVITGDTFLANTPANILQIFSKASPEYQNSRRVPILFSVNSGEGGVRSARFSAMPELIPTLDKNWDKLIGRVLLEDDPNLDPYATQSLKQIYFGTGGRSSEDLPGFIKNLTKLTSDLMFYQPVHDAAVENSKYQPTYMAYFNYKSAMLPGAYSFYRAVRPNQARVSEERLLQGLFRDWTGEHILGERGVHKYGVGHGEELFQLFNVNGFSKVLSDEDRKFSESFVKTIVDFASAREPLEFRGQAWPPVTSGLLRSMPEMLVPYMNMDNSGKGKLTEEPFYQGRLQLLNRLKVVIDLE